MADPTPSQEERTPTGLEAARICAEHLPSEGDNTATMAEVAQRRDTILGYLEQAKTQLDAAESLQSEHRELQAGAERWSSDLSAAVQGRQAAEAELEEARREIEAWQEKIETLELQINAVHKTHTGVPSATQVASWLSQLQSGVAIRPSILDRMEQAESALQRAVGALEDAAVQLRLELTANEHRAADRVVGRDHYRIRAEEIRDVLHAMQSASLPDLKHPGDG